MMRRPAKRSASRISSGRFDELDYQVLVMLLGAVDCSLVYMTWNGNALSKPFWTSVNRGKQSFESHLLRPFIIYLVAE